MLPNSIMTLFATVNMTNSHLLMFVVQVVDRCHPILSMACIYQRIWDRGSIL